MKEIVRRYVLFLSFVLLFVACSCAPNAKTPSGAAMMICEALMDGNYDAVLDRMYEWYPQQEEEFDITKWAEQVAARNIRTILQAQIKAVFDDDQNPVVEYEITGEEYASDELSARVYVTFVRQDDSILKYTFTMMCQEDGTWRSIKMFR